MQVTSVQVEGVAVVTIVVGGVGVGVMVGVGEGWWMKCQSDVGVGWEYRSASEQERIPTWCKDSRRTSAFRESPPTRKKSSCGPDAVRQHLLEEMEKSSEREGCSG